VTGPAAVAGPAAEGLGAELVDSLRSVAAVRVERNLALAPLSTYRVGGAADWGVFPQSSEGLASVVRLLREAGQPLQVLGRGSNVLIGDKGVRGAVVVLRELDGIEVLGERLVVGAGADCTDVAAVALSAELTGVEFFHWLPGSVGGAAFMNARAFEQEVSQIWRAGWVVTPTGELVERRYEPGDFAYKRSPLQDTGDLAARVDLHLALGDPGEIRATMERNEQKRRDNREMDHPSCGCVFKNDRAFGAPSGLLVDQCGLKGYRQGDAQVSPHHANFVINLGHATAADLRAVIEHVQRTVEKETGHSMEHEVRFVGDF
jgi:UDP-N-acetylmuramate dehydrogenase